MNIKRLILIIIGLIILIVVFSTFNISETILDINNETEKFATTKRKNVKVLIPEPQKKYYNFILEAGEKLNIESLLLSDNQLDIRFWLYPHIGKNCFLLSLGQKNNNWNGKLYFFQYSGDDNSFTDIKIRDIYPKTNWNNFINRLYHYGIFVLPDVSKLNIDETVVEDGGSFLIEVTDESYYRFYRYYNPDIFIDESFECDYVDKISQLIDKELEVDSLFYEYRVSKHNF